MTINTVINLLSQVSVPYLDKHLTPDTGLNVLNADEQSIDIQIKLGFPHQFFEETFRQTIIHLLKQHFSNHTINVEISSQIESKAIQSGLTARKEVKNIIAIASGKGGVGKSTVAVNVALALLKLGARVGLLDADIYGPNQPQMLGITEKPTATKDKKLHPMMAHGLQMMSIGLLINQTDTPMVWRGPMVSTALQQLFNDTQWNNLDYLIIDLPPGTGDVQLTLAQKIPVSGSVIVTTPQDVALLDVTKAVNMFHKVNIPVLGVIENMSMHICKQCGHQEAIFGEGGAQTLAAQYQLDLLGQLPLDIKIRQAIDQGKPTVVLEPESMLTKQYLELACRIASKLSLQKNNLMAKFPKIVVTN